MSDFKMSDIAAELFRVNPPALQGASEKENALLLAQLIALEKIAFYLGGKDEKES